MNFLSKLVGQIGDVKTVEAVQLWEVRWFSISVTRWTSGDPLRWPELKEQVEGFPTLEAAKAFADSLRTARQLMKDSAHFGEVITVTKGRSNL